ncbi:glycosyltransferase [Ectobacillus ponti]|uniref:Glycosyltransferase n=1 Tax=Ectobacillus ponti TaxID=2961894 RepID=A0AA41X353_9BACI|nr:glycosyltransferase [Ectobacillus ponti]
MKIVYICEAMGGGVRRHLLDLLNHIDLSEYNVSVIYGGERVDRVFAQSIAQLEQKGIHLFQVNEMGREISLTADIKAFLKVISLLAKIKPAIVHCHSSKAGGIGRIAARLIGVRKVFYTPHAYIFQDPNLSLRKGLAFRLVERVLGYITTRTVHVSKGEESVALQEKVISKDKSVVIYNGIEDAADGQHQHCREDDTFTIGTVARMDYQKNPWESIKIIEALLQVHRNIKYVYVGDGPFLSEISQYVKEKNLTEKIHVMGFKDNPSEYLDKFDVFLSTSLYEGMPYALIEALSKGVPIIASKVTGNDEVIQDTFNGYLYELGHINEAIDLFHGLIRNQEIVEQLSINSYKAFKEKFTIGKMVQAHQTLYSSKG